MSVLQRLASVPASCFSSLPYPTSTHASGQGWECPATARRQWHGGQVPRSGVSGLPKHRKGRRSRSDEHDGGKVPRSTTLVPVPRPTLLVTSKPSRIVRAPPNMQTHGEGRRLSERRAQDRAGCRSEHFSSGERDRVRRPCVLLPCRAFGSGGGVSGGGGRRRRARRETERRR